MPVKKVTKAAVPLQFSPKKAGWNMTTSLLLVGVVVFVLVIVVLVLGSGSSREASQSDIHTFVDPTPAKVPPAPTPDASKNDGSTISVGVLPGGQSILNLLPTLIIIAVVGSIIMQLLNPRAFRRRY